MASEKEQVRMKEGIPIRSNAGIGVKFFYHHKCSCDVREMLISPCMGAERNTNASNDNPLIIWRRKH